MKVTYYALPDEDLQGPLESNIILDARREVREETGYEVKLTGTIGIYNFISRLWK